MSRADLTLVWPPRPRGVAVITPPFVPPKERERASLHLERVRNEAIIGELRAQLNDANEALESLTTERDNWRRAYLVATARRPRRLLPLAWAMAIQLAWVRAWQLFETSEA